MRHCVGCSIFFLFYFTLKTFKKWKRLKSKFKLTAIRKNIKLHANYRNIFFMLLLHYFYNFNVIFNIFFLLWFSFTGRKKWNENNMNLQRKISFEFLWFEDNCRWTLLNACLQCKSIETTTKKVLNRFCLKFLFYEYKKYTFDIRRKAVKWQTNRVIVNVIFGMKYQRVVKSKELFFIETCCHIKLVSNSCVVSVERYFW